MGRKLKLPITSFTIRKTKTHNIDSISFAGPMVGSQKFKHTAFKRVGGRLLAVLVPRLEITCCEHVTQKPIRVLIISRSVEVIMTHLSLTLSIEHILRLISLPPKWLLRNIYNFYRQLERAVPHRKVLFFIEKAWQACDTS